MNQALTVEDIEGSTIWVSSVSQLEHIMSLGGCTNPDQCRRELVEYGVTGWLYVSQCRCPCPAEVRPFKVRLLDFTGG